MSKELSVGEVLALLAKGEMEVQGMMPWSTNYTLLVTVRDGDLEGLAVYKPRRGERPLWDFPRGTLCQRELAAFLLSEALGWSLVPPTVLRDGPYGYGSVQLYIDCDQDAHLFTMQKEGGYEDQLARLAAFDILSNNADRKSGHCLKGTDGRLWAIDHGICFHAEPKLRTVLWDFAGEPICEEIMADLRALREDVRNGGRFIRALEGLLAPEEVRAFRRRLDRLIETGCYPDPGAARSIPWPPV
ncbi:MAG: SCO1664 family protein [Roseiflexaceae bacterium]|nr:SCO1664 family protein [Roseiflexus sp.]MDW8215034.1 SCO1664 family protein [Roseiflexaceae bacterium]